MPCDEENVGLSVPDCNIDCVCHVTMKLSGLSVHMETCHGYHVHKR